MNRISLVLLILPIAAIADDPFACVDPDVAAAFLENVYQNPPAYSTEIPAAFDGVHVPFDFEAIGSESNRHALRAVYKATVDPDEAIERVVGNLTEDGWQSFAGLAYRARGFQSQSTPKMARVCRDSEPGLLTISANEISGVTYVSVSIATREMDKACEDLGSQDHVARFERMNVFSELPNLEIPDNYQYTSSGMGGGGNEFHTDVTIVSGPSRTSLLSHLGDQIRNQGWGFDTSWSGALSSGSVWTKKLSDGETLVGTLHAYGESSDPYHVRFGASPMNASSSAGAIRISN